MRKTFTLFITIATLIFALTACEKSTTNRRIVRPEQPYDLNKVVLRESSNLQTTYSGRTSIIEGGRDVYIDEFKINPRTDNTYYMDVISMDILNEQYHGSIQERIKAQANNFYLDEKDGYIDLNEIVMRGNNSVKFDRMHSGQWIMYAFEMNNKGEISGDYYSSNLNIKAETPTSEYKQWLGQWSIGNSKRKYVINITQDEPNYTYAVSGWENTNNDAKDLVFLSEFDRRTHTMLFVYQKIKEFKGLNDEFYDVIFCGTFDYKKGGILQDRLVFTDPSTIAEATPNQNGTLADVNACEVVVNIDNQDYRTNFAFMSFKDLPHDPNKPAQGYNEDVPEFPLEMEKLSSYTTRAAIKGYKANMIATRYKPATKTYRKVK